MTRLRRLPADLRTLVSTVVGPADAAGAEELSASIREIAQNDHQLTIASAVEEQTATTDEMSRSVAEAAGGTTAAGSTTQAPGQIRVAVDELSRMATDLRATVGRFTYWTTTSNGEPRR